MTDYSPGRGNLSQLVIESLSLRLRTTYKLSSTESSEFINEFFKTFIGTAPSQSNLRTKGRLIQTLLIDDVDHNPIPTELKKGYELSNLLSDLREEEIIKNHAQKILHTLDHLVRASRGIDKALKGLILDEASVNPTDQENFKKDLKLHVFNLEIITCLKIVQSSCAEIYELLTNLQKAFQARSLRNESGDKQTVAALSILEEPSLISLDLESLIKLNIEGFNRASKTVTAHFKNFYVNSILSNNSDSFQILSSTSKTVTNRTYKKIALPKAELQLLNDFLVEIFQKTYAQLLEVLGKSLVEGKYFETKRREYYSMLASLEIIEETLKKIAYA